VETPYTDYYFLRQPGKIAFVMHIYRDGFNYGHPCSGAQDLSMDYHISGTEYKEHLKKCSFPAPGAVATARELLPQMWGG